MTRFLTILAAALATASAQYGSSGGMGGGNYGGGQVEEVQQGNGYQQQQQGSGYQQQQQQQGSGYQQQQKSSNYNNNNNNNQQKSSNYGMQQNNNMYGMQQIDNSGGMAWQGMSQSSMQGQVVIIAVNNGGGKQWQQVSNKNDVYGMNKSPQTHQVTVGAPGLVYSPNSIQAAPGDYVQFNFMSENHTATQSNFDKPCVKMMGGADSGFMPNKANSTSPPPSMKVQVMGTAPMWFYCKQRMPKDHCGAGMTFSINPTAQKTQEMFSNMAMQQNGTGSTQQMNSSPPPSTVVQGNGQMNNGQCQCQCLCGSNQYAAGLGIGMMGGLGGMMPYTPAN